MQQLCTYLDAHPSEFCIVTIRHEVEADDGDSSFGSKLQASLAAIKDHLVDFRPNLTVGEARGKILFLSRDAYDEPMYGGRFADLSNNQSDINNMLAIPTCRTFSLQATTKALWDLSAWTTVAMATIPATMA